MPSVLKAIAPAKINLNLHVTGRRNDGYHLLESIITFADFGDEIAIKENEVITLKMSGPFSKGLDNENNLVIRATKILADVFKIKKGVEIELKKNIPVGAGLGGGSADAADVVDLLCGLWKIKITEKQKLEIGLKLGADVPVCQVGQPSFVRGIGEIVEPINNFGKLYSVLVNPAINLSTKDVFSRGIKNYSLPLKNLPERKDEWIDFLKMQRNDLTENSIHIVPEIKDLLRKIAATNDCIFSRMSGSGASCFGIYPDKNSAIKAARKLAEQNPKWWVKEAELRS